MQQQILTSELRPGDTMADGTHERWTVIDIAHADPIGNVQRVKVTVAQGHTVLTLFYRCDHYVTLCDRKPPQHTQLSSVRKAYRWRSFYRSQDRTAEVTRDYWATSADEAHQVCRKLRREDPALAGMECTGAECIDADLHKKHRHG